MKYKQMLEDINRLVETDFAEDVCWRSERGTISRDDVKKMAGIIGSVYLISHSIHCKSCGSEYRKETMNTLQQGQLKILNGLADDMPIEMNAGQLRALLATARAEGAAEERERIKQAWKKLNIMGAASAGSAQGVIVRNPWGETDGMQVDREAFRLFMQALTTKEHHAE